METDVLPQLQRDVLPELQTDVLPQGQLDVLPRLQTVFRVVFDDASIILTCQMTSGDFPAWDSMNLVKLIIECEQTFGVKIGPREINGLQTVGEIADHIGCLQGAERLRRA